MAMTEETRNVVCDPPRIDEATADRIRLLPLLAPWLRPAAWAPRTDRVSLRLAFLMHVLAGLGVLAVFLLLERFEACLRRGDHDMLRGLVKSLAQIISVFEFHAVEALLATAAIMAMIEIGCVVVALMIMPWAEADEPLRTSFARALRRVWLHTTQAVPLFVLGGAAVIIYEYKRWQFHVSPQYTVVRQSYHYTYPWWVRYDEVIIWYVAVALSVWFLWALFRAAGVPRRGSAPARPPTCEYCGYNLTGTAIESRCPECGVPAVMSLGPDVRRGTAYDRAPKGGFSVMEECWLDAILSPKTIGRQIQVTQPSRRYRRCLTAGTAPAFVVCIVGFLVALFVAERGHVSAHEMVEILLAMPLVGVCVPAGVLLLAMLITCAVGFYLSIREKRNLLPAAMQMQCYLGGFLLAWLAFGWFWSTVCISLDNARAFRNLETALAIDDEALAFFLWFLPMAGLLFLDGILVWKGTSSARYANR